LENEVEKVRMLRTQAVPSLSLILMGSMDWLTTIIGIVYFGAVESNPFLADITRTSLPVFTLIKLSTTVVIGLLFYKAEKTLNETLDKNTRSFKYAHIALRSAYIVALAFLFFAIINNLVVVVNAI
jgi:hypothetical protein